jgi:hypothetical protein
LLGSELAGLVGVCEEGGAVIPGGVVLGGFGYASVGWGVGLGAWVVGWRACVAGNGFQALHWNLLS